MSIFKVFYGWNLDGISMSVTKWCQNVLPWKNSEDSTSLDWGSIAFLKAIQYVFEILALASQFPGQALMLILMMNKRGSYYAVYSDKLGIDMTILLLYITATREKDNFDDR